MSIRCAILGAGRIGRVHARAIAANNSARLVAVYDPLEAAAKDISQQHGCAIKDVDAIALSADVDVVLICTPTDTHADLIEKFVRAGKIIFCEKPIDLSIERVKSCLKFVEQENARLMIGFNRRFDPHFRAVRAAIDEGRIGDIEQVVITSRDPGAPPAEYIKASGGIFRDMTIHDFDMARFLLGEEVESIFAVGSVLTDPAIGKLGDYDSVMVILRTASGRQAHINNSRRASYGYDQRIEVHGSKGMVQGHNPHPVMLEIADENGYSRSPLHDFFMTRYMEAYAAEIEALIKGIVSNTVLKPGGHDGLIALALAEAANISARSGREVKMSEIL